MEWNLQEFRDLCNQKQISETEIYQDALAFKIDRVYYHKEQLVVAYQNLLSCASDDDKYNEYEFIIQANLEAQLQSIHPLADIIAQIINVSILNNHFTESQVTFNKVYNKLNTMRGNPKIINLINAVECLKDSMEFSYINAFTNTIKHRTLIEVQLCGEFGMNTNNCIGVKINAFEYQNNNFSERYANEIIEDYTNRMIDMVCAIGIEINEYLK